MAGIKGQGKGRNLSLEHSRKISEALKGRVFSSEWKSKISLKNKGRKMSNEAIEKIKESKKKLTKENRLRISQAQIGKVISKETRVKISKANKGIKRSEATKQKMRLAQLGSKSHLWKGGISIINNRIRSSLDYRLWREAVFTRDNWTCVFCLTKGGTLNADHIKPFAYFPELRFAIDNGRTLCEPCHRTTDTYGGKAIKYEQRTL